MPPLSLRLSVYRSCTTRPVGFATGFGKQLKFIAAGVAKLAYAADSKWDFCSSARFETLHNLLIPQGKTTSTRSSRLLDFWAIFEAF
jgi:hypothetical protein